MITPTVVESSEATIDPDAIDRIRRLEQDQREDTESLDKEMDSFFGGNATTSSLR